MEYTEIQGSIIRELIYKGYDEVILDRFCGNVGAKRYSDLAVIRSLNKDGIAGCFRVILFFFNNVMVDDTLSCFLEGNLFGYFW